MGQLSPPDSRYFLILTNKTCKIASKSGFCPLLESDNLVLTCLPLLENFLPTPMFEHAHVSIAVTPGLGSNTRPRDYITNVATN